MRWHSLKLFRKIHTFLSVFFTPLLVLFLVTGFWQMAIPEEKRDEPGTLSTLMEKFSTIHKEGYFPRSGVANPSIQAFKILVGGLCGALLLSIVIGLILAWSHPQGRWPAVLALALGIIVPVVLLWLA